MVRFDFVFDSKLNIFLMEVNMSPNLSSAHFSANALLYEQVLFNTLHVAGIVNLRYKSSRFVHRRMREVRKLQSPGLFFR